MALSDAEWKVMEALWKGSPATVRDVVDRVGRGTGWAYTTVKTMLERMVEKGAIRRRVRDRVGWFEPVLTRRAARRSAVRSLLDRAFEGAFGSLLHHLASEERLTAADRRRLRDMLEKEDSPPSHEDTKKTVSPPRHEDTKKIGFTTKPPRH